MSLKRLELQNLGKDYPNTPGALRDVSLSMESGELLAVVGPSGCGKTSLLRLIAGLEQPTKGDILLDGESIRDRPARERDVAMVFQQHALLPHLRVRENIDFGLRLRGTPADLRKQRTLEAARQLRVDHLLERWPNSLSGGECQRVGLARAFVRDPRVFLLDEPLSQLDAALRAELRIELSQLHDSLAATMIFVTHDQSEAMSLGDRIVVMRSGEIQQIGDPHSVYSTPSNVFVASFMGAPGMNLLPCRRAGNADALQLSGDGFSLPVPKSLGSSLAEQERELTLGVRPEDLRASDTEESGLTVVVERIETRGADRLLHCRIGANTLCASVARTRACEVGQPLRLAVDAGCMHVFDAESGLRVTE